MLLLKIKKLWTFVVGTEVKPMTPTTTQIVGGTLILPFIGIRSIAH
jgi:hypothetical protein